MSSVDRIRKYISGIKIRKTLIGGYDREDVYMKINELVDVFKEYVKEELETQESQKHALEKEIQQQKLLVEEYEKKLHESQALVVDLNMKLKEVTSEQASTVQEMEILKETYKNYCSNILEQYSGSLRILSTEFSKILDNISMLQQNIVDFETLENGGISAEELNLIEIEIKEEDSETVETEVTDESEIE